MADAGEIKARVVIEYDGSGIDAAKEDLAKLGELAGGIGGGEGGIGDAIAAMGDQFAEGTKGASEFADSIGAIEEPLRSGEAAVSQLNDALDEHQQAIEGTGAAYEALQEPLGTTVSMLEEAAPPMLQIAENAQKISAPLSDASDNFAQLQDSLSQTVPMLPQFADSLHEVSAAFDPQQFGLNDFAENMAVFQDALQNPTPFSMIGQYLQETGQTWDDFNSSIGADNVSALHDMAQNANVAGESLNALNTSAESTGQAFSGSREETQAFTEQYNALGGAAQDASKSMEDVSGTVEDLGSTTEKAGGIFSSIFGEGGFLGGIGEGVGGFFGSIGNGIGNIMMGFDSLARPLFTAQMIGQMASSFGSWLYNANLAAEGPNASNPASFTSQVNQLGANAQAGTNQFAVGFGAGLNPSINAWNNQNSQGGGSDFWSGIGRFLGGVVGGGADVLQTLGGSLLYGLSFGNAGMMQTGINWENSGMQGLVNMYDAANGLPLQYPGTPSYAGATPFERMALSNWYAQPGGMTSAQTGVAADWQYFNDMPQGGAPSGPIVSRYTPSGPNAYTQPQGLSGALQDIGNFFSGIGQNLMHLWDPTGDLNNLGSIGAGGSFGGGCFAAGTPVLMADGTAKPIETLQIGERVLAHNGIDEVITTVQARLTPPARVTYELKFSDGHTLTTTDSHPIATPLQGWKAISPVNARRENPDLPISLLQEGDSILTFYGACRLVTIEKKQVEHIYNITVDEPHTFYVNGVLVHNKVALGGGAQSFTEGGIGSEAVQLSHTFTANVTWEAQNLTKSFTAVANWAASGLTHAFQAVASWAASGLTHAFQAVASWAASGLSHAFTAVAQWASQGLNQMFTAVAQWTAQNLVQPFIAIAQWTSQNLVQPFIAIAEWTGQGLMHAFTAIASWVGQNLTHTFVGIAQWIGEGLQHTFMAAASWMSAPGFATGVENFAGGPAIVGEGGAPEVVEHNGQFTMYDQPTLLNLPSGASVYPMQELSSGSSPRQLAAGTVGDTTPISLNIGSGSAGAHTANINVYLDSQMLIQALGASLMSSINVSMGKRSF